MTPMGGASPTRSAHPQYDLAQNVPLRQPLMRLLCVGQRDPRRDRHLKARRFDRPPQTLELLAAWRAVVRLRLDPAAMLRLGLDPVRVGEPSAFPQRVDAAFQCLATSEGQDRVDTFRRELLHSMSEVAGPAVNRRVRTQLAR